MRRNFAAFSIGCAVLIALAVALPRGRSSAQSAAPVKFSPAIPRTWDDPAMAELEVPLADPSASPKQVSADYYYRIPVRPIFKTYAVYAPGHEPAGYIEWLNKQEPVLLWDDKGHGPPLATEADWIEAGKLVFEEPLFPGPLGGHNDEGLYVRDPDFYRQTGTPVAADGTVPFYRYMVLAKGKVAVGILACAMCHSRVMSDGSILKGAQGNFPFDRAFAWNYRHGGDFPESARSSSTFSSTLRGSIPIRGPDSTKCRSRRLPPFTTQYRPG